MTSVQCVAGVTDHLVRRIKEEILPRYPNVDDVVAIDHTLRLRRRHRRPRRRRADPHLAEPRAAIRISAAR